MKVFPFRRAERSKRVPEHGQVGRLPLTACVSPFNWMSSITHPPIMYSLALSLTFFEIHFKSYYNNSLQSVVIY